MKIINVAGARPNFMKIAPLTEAFSREPNIESILVHTGQHYDENMSDLLFRQLGMPQPDINLCVGSGSHAAQTAGIMKAFEPVVVDYKPDAVLVAGDVNSTLACGLVAAKLGVKLAHVEAGLRSFDRTMPEEINRVLTDAVSDLLFCTERSGMDNLKNEGVPDERMFLVGNVMIDALLRHKSRADASPILENLGISPGKYAVLTLHRAGNVDDPAVFGRLLDAIETIQNDMPVVFPVHPRTRKNIQAMGIEGRMAAMTNLRRIDPLGYLDFLKLTSRAGCVLTDSGGIQAETTVLKVPCLTFRENCECPVTLEIGSNQLVGTDPQRILAAYRTLKSGKHRRPGTPPLWDGHAAERIAKILVEKLG